ncbi:DUF4132 domain-containing protein [Yinghuangia sp. YIM S09857]|uniref:DUF4132 domain-containing protein n=1 Tax=Yinghuangia sp. YIM S09857 TaxID=3436929 RepID=UPI003F5330FE
MRATTPTTATGPIRHEGTFVLPDTWHRSETLLASAPRDPEQLADALRGYIAVSLAEATGAAVDGTALDGVDVRWAAAVVHELTGVAQTEYSYMSPTDQRKLHNVLVELPTDEAFRTLLDHIDQARAAVLAAAKRYPVRALRLLADAAIRDPEHHATTARQLLTAHIDAHRELVASVRPMLDAETVAVVDAQTRATVAAVEIAPADEIPEVLATPPWTRKRTRPVTVPGLAADPEPFMVWQPEERTAFSAPIQRGFTPKPVPADTDTLDALRSQTLPAWEAVQLFLQNPDADLGDDLRRWRPNLRWFITPDARALLAAYETDAVPLVHSLALESPVHRAALLMPVVGLDTARLMAGWLHRRSDIPHDVAAAWLTRHADDAARLLVPDAVGKAGPERRAAEHALRHVASVRDEETVRTAAAAYGARATAAIEVMFATDPLSLGLPSRMPALPDWASPALLPQVTLRSGAALPEEAVGALLGMLAISKPGARYAGLAEVKAACAPDVAAGFAWALFEAWRLAGLPPKEAWAFHALGVLGTDDTADLLEPIVMRWPHQGVHKRAVDGIDVLAAIGTPATLRRLLALSRGQGLRAVRTRARDNVAQVAASLGLSDAQLADRLVPDFGLDADGTTVLDFGPRRFTVGFDAWLKPYVVGEDGRQRKDLPPAGPSDDAEAATAARERFAALKKDVRKTAAEALRRLETAMTGGRTWAAEEFREFVAEQPLIRHLARRLVWSAAWSAAIGTVETVDFRITEDGTYEDVDGGVCTFASEETSFAVAHPAELGDDLPRWAAVFAAHGIDQPFAQLDRPVHAPLPGESADAVVARYAGAEAETTRLLGLERRGWVRETPGQGGYQCVSALSVGEGWEVTLSYRPGIYAGAPAAIETQTLEAVELTRTGAGAYVSALHRRTFDDLGAVLVSEILAALDAVAGPPSAA